MIVDIRRRVPLEYLIQEHQLKSEIEDAFIQTFGSINFSGRFGFIDMSEFDKAMKGVHEESKKIQ